MKKSITIQPIWLEWLCSFCFHECFDGIIALQPSIATILYLKMALKMEEIIFMHVKNEIFVKVFQTRQVMSGLRCRMKLYDAERRSTVYERA